MTPADRIRAAFAAAVLPGDPQHGLEGHGDRTDLIDQFDNQWKAAYNK